MVLKIVLGFLFLGAMSIVICLIGLFANTVSIPVLRTKDLYTSTFNRLLIVLAVCDNLYLLFALLESIRTEMELSTDIHTMVFPYAFYPLHNIMLVLSIYMTVILAMERYRAISKPIDYHTIIVSGKQWQRVFHYVVPVVIFSVLFNMPKFFELTTEGNVRTTDNGTNYTSVSNLLRHIRCSHQLLFRIRNICVLRHY